MVAVWGCRGKAHHRTPLGPISQDGGNSGETPLRKSGKHSFEGTGKRAPASKDSMAGTGTQPTTTVIVPVVKRKYWKQRSMDLCQ